MTETVRVAMWSGPRNISTAMMRSWGARAGTVVMDEPFYGPYLRATGIDHPMRDETLASRPEGWDEMARICATRSDAPVVYQKHMCQHMVEGAPLDWMSACRHAFLIRPPEEVAPSFHRGWPGMAAENIGFRAQAALYDRVVEMTGQTPPVIEARDVLENPDGMLRALCSALGVAFDPAMLAWAPGRRAEDGVWGAHWYKAVEASTGFAPPRPAEPVPPELDAIVAECRPHYERLAAVRLEPAS